MNNSDLKALEVTHKPETVAFKSLQRHFVRILSSDSEPIVVIIYHDHYTIVTTESKPHIGLRLFFP